MNRFVSLLLIVSLAVNAALAAVLLYHPSVPVPTAASDKMADAATVHTDEKAWAGIATDDLPNLAERLRARGFPDYVVRAIVRAKIAKGYRDRYKALLGDAANQAYWKNQVYADVGKQKALRELNREEQELVKAVLGPDPEQDGSNYGGRNLAFLPSEKAAAVRKVMEDNQTRMMDVFSDGPFNQTKYLALQKELRAGIAQVLTPAEMLEYDLRNNETAQQMRNQLSVFKPSEQEFRDIYTLRAAFDEKYSYTAMGGMPTQEQMKQRNEAEKLLTEQIKAALAPERAALYDRSTDSNYVRTSQLVARLELPPENADALYGLQKEYQDKMRDLVRNAPTGDREAWVQQMTALHEEATAKVAPLLGGANRLDIYKQYGGSWLNGMVPRSRISPSSGSTR